MPTNQPNNAAEMPADAREDTTAAAVLSDEQLDDPPGGGGMGGAAAADPLGGSARSPGGTSRNAPIDGGVDAGGANATAEAKVLAARDEAEAHPS
jgi:hypothetical protein